MLCYNLFITSTPGGKQIKRKEISTREREREIKRERECVCVAFFISIWLKRVRVGNELSDKIRQIVTNKRI